MIAAITVSAGVAVYFAAPRKMPIVGQTKAVAAEQVQLAPIPPTEAEPEKLLRIYDFTPVSPVNPVVASVQGTEIVVPKSEFEAYLKGQVSEDTRKALDMPSKRKHLERLVDDLVMLRDAYRREVDRKDPIARSLAGTRGMLLVELLNREEVGDKAKSAEEYAKLQAELDHRLFEAAEISVSNEAYAALRDAIERDAGEASLAAGLGAQTLASCGESTVTIEEAFATYAGLAPGKRPNVMAPEGLSQLLEKIMADGLKMAEARRRGIDRRPQYRAMVEANRASLTRMWLEDRITDKAMAQAKGDAGHEQIEILRERIRAVRAASLREGLDLEIDEGRL